MKLYPKRVECLGDLHEIVSRSEFDKSVFRGVRDAEHHQLVPKLGRRSPAGRMSLRRYENRLFRLFKERSLPHLQRLPTTNLEWLSLAQHHGLPTRLLDWSYNPLVAAFFAVEKEHDVDSAIYAMTTGKSVGHRRDPFKLEEVVRYRPRHLNPRIAAQAGVFTIHPSPQQAYESDRVTKLIVDQKARSEILERLYRYGISWSSLFPGLDGLCKQLDWRYTDS